MKCSTVVFNFIIILSSSSFHLRCVDAFVANNDPTRPHKQQQQQHGTIPRPSSSSSSLLWAKKPQRLEENVKGVVYVNDRCINCAACSNFAPSSFSIREDLGYHVVHHQPTTEREIQEARSALAACPVAAIRLETLAERRHRASTPDEKAAVEQAWTADDEQLVQRMQVRPSRENDNDNDNTNDNAPFPRRFLDDSSLKDDIYWLGHHNEKSFGATPYLLRTTIPTTNNNAKQHNNDKSNDDDEESVWIMIDTPKFTPSAVRDVERLTGPQGPQYLFLTHVDDTADHGKWANHFNTKENDDSDNDGSGKNLQRIFHALELDRNWVGDESLKDVEILLPPPPHNNVNDLTAYNLKGELLPADWYETCHDPLVILHTPGHSPGSITLYRRPGDKHKSSEQQQQQLRDEPGILFTGDTYGWTPRGGGKMTAFGRYGYNLSQQAQTLQQLVSLLDWDIIAPGHGHPRDYRPRHDDGGKAGVNDPKELQQRKQNEELRIALEDMTVSRRWR